MNNSRFYQLDFGDIIPLYEAFIDYVSSNYGVEFLGGERVFKEVVETHIRAILNRRTHTSFNPIVDDWRERLIEMIFPNQFDDAVKSTELHLSGNRIKRIYHSAEEIISGIANNNQYLLALDEVILNAILPALKNNDPLFSVWEVEYDAPIVNIEYQGDYRILQWHRDYGVPFSTTNEVTTIEIKPFIHAVERFINYAQLPHQIDRTPKKKLTRELVEACISYFLDAGNQYQRIIFKKLTQLVDEPDVVYERIKTYFALEYQLGLYARGNQRPIKHFVISDDTVTIHYSMRIVPRNHHSAKQRLQIEQQNADMNMDYIPPRQRLT